LPTLAARGPLKVVAMLDAAALAKLAVPATARVELTVATPDGTAYAVDLAAKSLRKAQSTLAEHGAENCVALIQGKLSGARIAEAGLVCNVKLAKELA
jgi:hypothetical protein